MQTNEALRNLYKKVTGTSAVPTEDQIADLVQKLADDWPAGGGYTLPAAAADKLGGVKQASEVTFVTEGATADTCATAIKAILDALKASGAME